MKESVNAAFYREAIFDQCPLHLSIAMSAFLDDAIENTQGDGSSAAQAITTRLPPLSDRKRIPEFPIEESAPMVYLRMI